MLCLPPHSSGDRTGQEAADAEHPAGSDLSSSPSHSFLLLLPLPTPPPQCPANLTCSFWSSECGERLGHEHLDLTDGQHLSSCYPSTCITDILLSYKHPEVSFSMEQAGV